jgi:hypothetical protein
MNHLLKVFLLRTGINSVWLPCIVLLSMSSCYSHLTMDELNEKMDELKMQQEESKKEEQEVLAALKAKKEESDKEIKDIGNKLNGLDKLKGQENQKDEYYRIAVEALYLVLKGKHTDYSKQIIAHTDNGAYRIRLVGCTLYKAVKDKDLDLESVLGRLCSIITAAKGYYSFTNNIVTYIRRSLLEAIIQKDKETLLAWKQQLNNLYHRNPSISYYNFDEILEKLVNFIAENGHMAAYQENFKFLINSIEVPNDLIEKLIATIEDSLTGENTEEEENKKELLKRVLSHKAKQQLSVAPPLPTAKSIYYNPTISQAREQGKYSDSEEEQDAPHFNGIYNFTKHGVFDIQPDSEEETQYYAPIKMEGNLVNNYVTEYKDILLDKLQEDAIAIHPESKKDKVKFSKTTTLCVALRQNDGRIKKFVFTTLPSLYQGDYKESNRDTIDKISKKAHELSYHVIMAQQAHAEGELMQFLQERTTRYTHTVGMGCSRGHCLICDDMMQKFLGFDYKKTLSISGTSSADHYTRWYKPVALEHFLNRHQCAPDTEGKKVKNYLWDEDQQQQHQRLLSGAWGQRPWKQPKPAKKKQEVSKGSADINESSSEEESTDINESNRKSEQESIPTPESKKKSNDKLKTESKKGSNAASAVTNKSRSKGKSNLKETKIPAKQTNTGNKKDKKSKD